MSTSMGAPILKGIEKPGSGLASKETATLHLKFVKFPAIPLSSNGGVWILKPRGNLWAVHLLAWELGECCNTQRRRQKHCSTSPYTRGQKPPKKTFNSKKILKWLEIPQIPNSTVRNKSSQKWDGKSWCQCLSTHGTIGRPNSERN